MKFLGPRNKNAPKMIWVPKTLVEKAFPSGIIMVPTKTVWCPSAKLEPLRKRYTKGYKKANEMMIHQALNSDLKGFDETIKKHKVERKNKPHKLP